MLGIFLYPLAAVIGLLLSAWAWERNGIGPSATAIQRHGILLGCLVGVVVGAKCAYLLSEGWLDASNHSLSASSRALALLQGKSVTGALLGGYLGVELAKRKVNYAASTGDIFALLAPFSLGLGRLGCWSQGCCLGVVVAPSPFAKLDAQGISRWPAVPLEFTFNAIAFAAAALVFARRKNGLRDHFEGQLFHVYLMAYGAFRLMHEFFRETPRIGGVISGYQLFALALVVLGFVRFRHKRQHDSRPLPLSCVR